MEKKKKKNCHHFKFQNFLLLPFLILSVLCAEGRGGGWGGSIWCYNSSHKSNVSHWPLSRFVYSCIANTKIPTRAAYAIWPRGELLWSDVITPHCHKWTPSLPRLPVNKFPRGPCSFVPAPLCSRWTWNNCHAKSRVFPFLILRVNNILIQF